MEEFKNFFKTNFRLFSDENDEFINDHFENYKQEVDLIKKFYYNQITKKKNYIKLIRIFDMYDYVDFEEYITWMVFKYKKIRTNFFIRGSTEKNPVFKKFLKGIKDPFLFACKRGYAKLAEKIFDGRLLHKEVIYAINSGNLDLVKFLIPKIYVMNNEYIFYACKDIKMLELFSEFYEKKSILYNALRNDNSEIFSTFFDEKIFNVNMLYSNVGSLNCLKWLKTKGYFYPELFIHSLLLGCLNTAQWLFENSQYDIIYFNMTFNLEILKFLEQKNLLILYEDDFFINHENGEITLCSENIDILNFLMEGVNININILTRCCLTDLNCVKFLFEKLEFSKYDIVNMLISNTNLEIFRFLCSKITLLPYELNYLFFDKICNHEIKIVKYMYYAFDLKINISLINRVFFICTNFSILDFLFDKYEKDKNDIVQIIYSYQNFEHLKFLDKKGILNYNEALEFFRDEQSTQFLMDKGGRNESMLLYYYFYNEERLFNIMIGYYSEEFLSKHKFENNHFL